MLRSFRTERSLVIALIAAGALAGCHGATNPNGGFSTGSSGSSNFPAATNSQTTASSNSSSTTTPTTASPVSASLTINAFAAFRENASFADLQMPADQALKNKAFALEDKGTVRVLDFSAPTVALDRAIPLEASGSLTSGAAAASLTISDGQTALVAANGAEAVYIFDPTSAQTAADVTKIDLSQMAISWNSATTDSKGAAVASPMNVSFTASAIVSQQKLYVATSNLNLQTYAYNPGTVLAYDYNATTRAATNASVIQTSAFDPTRITRWQANGAEALLCVNAGIAGVSTQQATIDVIDPARALIVATIPCGASSVSGEIAISADGKRGFVGSMSGAAVYELDLSNLDQELTNAQAKSEPARFVGKIALASTGGLDFISSVALSHSGTYLYAINFNKSELSVIDVALGKGKSQVVGTLTGFQRSGNPAQYQGNADFVVVRPGVPGVDFTGPAAFVGTIGLAPADQTVPNVAIALDGVTFDKN